MIGIPKPLKSQRPNEKRKQEIKRKDKEFSKATETFRCEECGKLGPTDPAHIVPRRFMDLRHERSNIKRKCRSCHRKEKYDKNELKKTIYASSQKEQVQDVQTVSEDRTS